MAYINDEVYDGGLDYAVANGTKVDICNADVGSSFANIATYTLGNKTGLTLTLADGAVDGRKAVVPAIVSGSPGTVTATDDATHWAVSDGTSILVASGELSALQGVTSGNDFTLDAIDIALRDATSV